MNYCYVLWVSDFFGKRIPVGDFKEIFEFITSPTIDDTNYLNVLEEVLKNAKKWEYLDVPTEVFRQTFIPRKMEEVSHVLFASIMPIPCLLVYIYELNSV